MLATSKNVLFPGHNNLLTTMQCLWPNTLIITLAGVSGHQHRRLAGGYDLKIGLFRSGWHGGYLVDSNFLRGDEDHFTTVCPAEGCNIILTLHIIDTTLSIYHCESAFNINNTGCTCFYNQWLILLEKRNWTHTFEIPVTFHVSEGTYKYMDGQTDTWWNGVRRLLQTDTWWNVVRRLVQTNTWWNVVRRLVQTDTWWNVVRRLVQTNTWWNVVRMLVQTNTWWNVVRMLVQTDTWWNVVRRLVQTDTWWNVVRRLV